MILSEEYVKVPGKMYKVKVQCVSTRRLTTMEWLIVNCAAKFQGSIRTGQLTLKQVFEDVFQLTSSEILIKPCVESLINEQAIILEAGTNFDYSSLKLAQIHLTDKGRRMVQDGLFPGAPKELPLDIYYNPLTEKMNQFVGGNEKVDEAIEFGTESDYSTEFPEEKIIEALHRGMVGRGKFVASKLRIESIECMASTDWENYIKIEVNSDSKGNITTKPEIKEENVKSLITSMFFTKEITSSKIGQLVWKEETQPGNIFGSGKKMKETFLEVCKNGSYVGVSESAYSIYKRNTSAFKKKIILVWNAEKLVIQKENESTYVYLPAQFSVVGCEAINEKNESVSFCKSRYIYDNSEIIVPIAFEDKKVKEGSHSLFSWIEEIIKEKCESDVRYIALYSLRCFEKSEQKAEGLLSKRWSSTDADQITKDLQEIFEVCMELGTEMLQLNNYGLELCMKFENSDTEEILHKLGRIMQLNCISSGSETQKYILSCILNRAEAPKTYNDLFVLLQSVGIRTHADALMYDEIVSHLYTRELIIDTLSVIMNDKFTKLPELFELDSFFNEYVQDIKELEFLIADLKMFERMDADAIERAIEKCPDVALIQSYAAEIVSKNAELLNRGINVYAELKNIDLEKTEQFFNNLEVIRQKVAAMMQTETKAIVSKVVTTAEGEKKTSSNRMYIVDTCALMHHPELLLYFSEEEYVRIPTKVIDELGKIKDMRSSKYSSDVSRTAAKLAYDIERKYLKLFNMDNKMRLMIENAELDLLPEELDKKVPDNQILSVAMKYKEWETVIISDDGVFRLTSIAQNIQAVTSEEFIEDHAIYKKSLDRWVEKFAKAGGKLNLQSTVPLAKPKEEIQADLVKNDTNEAISCLEQKRFDDPAIDILPIRELKKFLSADLTESAFTLLQNNGIKTVGQFRKLTPKDVDGFKAKGKQTILKNNIQRAIAKFKEMQGMHEDNAVTTNIIEVQDDKNNNKNDNVEDQQTALINGLLDSNMGTDGEASIDSDEVPLEIRNLPESISEFENHKQSKTEIGELVVLLRKSKMKESRDLYMVIAEGWNEKQRISFFVHLFTRVNQHESVLQLMGMVLSALEIKYIFNGYSVDQLDSINKKIYGTKLIKLLQAVYESGNKEGFSGLVCCLDAWEKVDFITDSEKKECYLLSNTLKGGELWINAMNLTDCHEFEKVMTELVDYLKPTVAFSICIEAWKKEEISKQNIVNVIEIFARKNAKGSREYNCPLEVYLSLISNSDDGEWELIKKLVEKTSSKLFSYEKLKRYPQDELQPKIVRNLELLAESNISLDKKIYIFMNTTLREDAQLDKFYLVLKEKSNITLEQFLSEMRNYWLIGKIKYVTEDGFVRIIPYNVSTSRLVCFWSNDIHISAEDRTWIEPKEGEEIYFLLRRFDEKTSFFTIHYPCIKPMEIKE